MISSQEEVPVIFLTAKGTVLRRCGKTGRVLSLPPDIGIDTAAHTMRRDGASAYAQPAHDPDDLSLSSTAQEMAEQGLCLEECLSPAR